ncbi:hypothetical protein [Actinomycetospora straminea]|uniref:hypothetical protein n=1 Tax=Actinomycetospora straminea TaxID=663607 RepID=UPI0023652E03|nr:hypothetical protein [Actinomycetospora straminea]MDD7936122.1 hypothetical protein [Actinomycetospora straminea]
MGLFDVDEVAVLQRRQDSVAEEGDGIRDGTSVARGAAEFHGPLEGEGVYAAVQRVLVSPPHRLGRTGRSDREVEHRVCRRDARRGGAGEREVGEGS